MAWTVIDEFDKRLGEITIQYEEDLDAIKAKRVQALDDLYHWFNRNYKDVLGLPWPKEAG